MMRDDHCEYALITGGSRGLGRAIAEELARRGVPTLLVGTNERVLHVCDEIANTYHTPSLGFVADLTCKDEVQALAETVNNDYKLFMLINNAGVGGSKRFEEASVEYIDNILQLNVRCTALLTRQLLPNLMRRKRAYILNIGSMAACTPSAFKTVYPASKSFVRVFSIGLREELRSTPVTVSVALPGAIATNAEVSERISRQGFWGRATLKSPAAIACRCVDGMLKGRRQIILNPLAYFLCKLVPECVRVPLLSRIVRREVGR
jgi:short-subunit dehydrogenase